MDSWISYMTDGSLWLVITGWTVFLLLCWKLLQLVFWAKGRSTGAYLFLAIFPLVSIFPIPPPAYENVEKAKQEQRKTDEDPGDPPEPDEPSH